MSIGIHDRRRLLLRCGGICAFPGCGEPLLEPTADGTEDTNIGIECHIVAQKDDPKVARAPSSLSPEECRRFAHLIDHRDGFDNLVMMCLAHSRIIDDPAQSYPVEAVVEMKRSHEDAVAPRRSAAAHRADDAALIYGEIVDEWARRFALDDWPRHYYRLVGDGHPMMDQEDFDALSQGREWLFKRVWPGSIPELEAAFTNFRWVCGDLQAVLSQHRHEVFAKDGVVAIARFYNDSRYWEGSGAPDHERLRGMYQFYSALVEDLTYELTRAANLICDVVRRRLDSRFRFEEGVLTLESGPYMDTDTDFKMVTRRPHYSAADGGAPYHGLDDFLSARAGRDHVRGEGGRPDGIKLPGDPRL
jgi:hypothetical protein